MKNEIESHEHDNNTQPLAADGGLPSVARKSSSTGTAQKIVVLGICVITILALAAVNGVFSSDDDSKNIKNESTLSIANRLGPTPEPPPPPIERTEPTKREDAGEAVFSTQMAPPPPISGGTPQNQISPRQRKRMGTLVMGTQGTTTPSETPTAIQTSMGGLDGDQPHNRADDLATMLKPTRVQGARASILQDRSFFLTKGTNIDCTLSVAISSDQPGGLTCVIARDVYSTDGKIKLLEAGSVAVGEYRGGLMRGQARIFAIWTRIETPSGVLIELDSPATDALGRGGIGGYIDTHFAERFGGSIMLSIIGDIGRYASNRARSGDNNQIQFAGTSDSMRDAAAIALENSINIPNTLHANQGDIVNIYVARDLDFRGVYSLEIEK